MSEYNIISYGAAADGVTMSTACIQKAIDDCHAAGGGRVTVPAGLYRIGTLVLKSGVELHLEQGATLKASDQIRDFNGLGLMEDIPEGMKVPSYAACDYNGNPSLYYIYAKDAENIAITGRGTIDGNESIFYGEVTPYHIDGSFYPRSPLICMENVENLTIQGVTLTGSAFWTTHLIGCRDVLIEGIRILNNLLVANCDGIDPDHCQNVRIANCYIRCADDGIVLKNTEANMQYGPCENIVVTGCNILSSSGAFKIGTESCDTFRNIIIQGCNIMSPTNRGITLQLRDRGNIENVLIENLNINTQIRRKPFWWGDAEPIAITAIRRKPGAPVGKIRGVQLRNINCEGENGILLYGDKDENGATVDDITLDNVSVRLRKTGEEPWETYDLRPTEDPAVLEETGSDIIRERHHGLYARHVGKITLRSCRFAADPSVKGMADADIDAQDTELVQTD